MKRAIWHKAEFVQPTEIDWPIIAFFGKACEGCRGPCVMLTNWNETFTHWMPLESKELQKALDSIPMPKPPVN